MALKTSVRELDDRLIDWRALYIVLNDHVVCKKHNSTCHVLVERQAAIKVLDSSDNLRSVQYRRQHCPLPIERLDVAYMKS